MIQFKSKHDTNPSKLASAITYNIANSDIEIACAGSQAVDATVKGLIIAKKYTQNEEFKLKFDVFSLKETDESGDTLNIIKFVVSKEIK